MSGYERNFDILDEYSDRLSALGEDLKAINPLLADSGLVKIFHAAEYDLMLLKDELGVETKGIFDTQVAMTLLRHQKTGLAALLESHYGIKVSKKHQRSDWGKRPLSDSQLEYARTDTRFLPDVRVKLMAKARSTFIWRQSRSSKTMAVGSQAT